MPEINLLTFSIIVPICALIGLLYRFIVFRYWDVEFVVFGMLGVVPILNLMLGLCFLFCLIGDLKDTPKACSLTSDDLKKFARERISSGWEY